MNITQISDLLGVDNSFTYRIMKQFPNEAPKTREYLAEWAEFIRLHRVEPVGADRLERMPSLKSTSRK
jgi:hypothetical protein